MKQTDHDCAKFGHIKLFSKDSSGLWWPVVLDLKGEWTKADRANFELRQRVEETELIVAGELLASELSPLQCDDEFAVPAQGAHREKLFAPAHA